MCVGMHHRSASLHRLHDLVASAHPQHLRTETSPCAWAAIGPMPCISKAPRLAIAEGIKSSQAPAGPWPTKGPSVRSFAWKDWTNQRERDELKRCRDKGHEGSAGGKGQEPAGAMRTQPATGQKLRATERHSGEKGKEAGGGRSLLRGRGGSRDRETAASCSWELSSRLTLRPRRERPEVLCP